MHPRNDKPSLFTLIRFARENRKHPTRSEAMLWLALRRWRLGPRFRRQHPIDCYIVDFACTTHRLVVEVDGGIHLAQREHDERRQRIIESLGWLVVRLDASLVERDLVAALAIVRAALTSTAALPTSGAPRPPILPT